MPTKKILKSRTRSKRKRRVAKTTKQLQGCPAHGLEHCTPCSIQAIIFGD